MADDNFGDSSSWRQPGLPELPESQWQKLEPLIRECHENGLIQEAILHELESKHRVKPKLSELVFHMRQWGMGADIGPLIEALENVQAWKWSDIEEIVMLDLATFFMSEDRFCSLIASYLELSTIHAPQYTMGDFLEAIFRNVIHYGPESYLYPFYHSTLPGLISNHYFLGTRCRDVSRIQGRKVPPITNAWRQTHDDLLVSCWGSIADSNFPGHLTSAHLFALRSLLMDGTEYSTLLAFLQRELAGHNTEHVFDSLISKTSTHISVRCLLRYDSEEMFSASARSAPSVDINNHVVIIDSNSGNYRKTQYRPTTCYDHLSSLGVDRPADLTNIFRDYQSHRASGKLRRFSNNTLTEIRATRLEVKVSCETSAQHVDFRFAGPPFAVVIAMKAIIFLVSAFRLKTGTEILMTEPTELEPSVYETNFLQLTFKRSYANRRLHDACWRPLFPSVSIVRDHFLVNQAGTQDRSYRDGFEGLEVSPLLMLELIQPFFPNVDEIGIWLETEKFLLVPIYHETTIASLRKGDALDAVQWHLHPIRGETFEQSDILVLKERRLRFNRFTELFNAKRVFIGYCGSSRLNLGGNDASTLEIQTHSRAKDEILTGSYKIYPNIAVGLGYKGYVNASATSEFSYNRAIFTAIDQEQSYGKILKISRRLCVIVYDDCGRGWLIPWINLLLHLVHLSAAKDYELDAPLPTIQYPQPQTSTDADAAYKVLYQHGGFLLEAAPPDSDGKDQRICDVVKTYWNVLIALVLAQIQASLEPRHQTQKLYGWDMLDIALCPTWPRRKEVNFHGNWLSLARRPDVLVLFGQNLNEIVQAMEPLCPAWESNKLLPMQPLTAYNSCLMMLAHRNGVIEGDVLRGCVRLGDDVYWPITDARLFETCSNCLGSYPCHKTPQQMRDCESNAEVVLRLEPRGAVVFGVAQNQEQGVPPEVVVVAGHRLQGPPVEEVVVAGHRLQGLPVEEV